MISTVPLHADTLAESPLRTAITRTIGGLLLVQWVLVATIKTTQGRATELLWVSHVGLLLMGIALITRTPRLARSVLIMIALPHLLWLGDAAGLGVLGRSPLGITAYLSSATTADWVATAHHFTLLTILILLLAGQAGWKRQDALRAWAILLACMWAGRVVGDSASNINYSYGLLGGFRHPWLDWLNTTPAPVYIALATLGSGLAIILPGSVLTRRIACAGVDSSHAPRRIDGLHLDAPTP